MPTKTLFLTGRLGVKDEDVFPVKSSLLQTCGRVFCTAVEIS